MKECHESPWVGHPGMHRSLAFLERGFFLKKMHKDVEEYVHMCIIFQQDKSDTQRHGGLLQPLPILERPLLKLATREKLHVGHLIHG